MIEKATSGNDEIPCFHAIRSVIRAAKTGLILSDEFVKAKIHRHGIRRRRVMKIENGNLRKWTFHFGLLIRNILRNQMVDTRLFLLGANHLGYVPLPLECDSAKVRFVANFIIEIIKAL